MTSFSFIVDNSATPATKDVTYRRGHAVPKSKLPNPHHDHDCLELLLFEAPLSHLQSNKSGGKGALRRGPHGTQPTERRIYVPLRDAAPSHHHLRAHKSAGGSAGRL